MIIFAAKYEKASLHMDGSVFSPCNLFGSGDVCVQMSDMRSGMFPLLYSLYEL